ncbi:MAG TPA: hypothetical protein VGE09_06380 [Pseudoxanthomonas sp.]
MMADAIETQSWGNWAIQFEEVSGLRIHGDIVDEALDAWRDGVTPAQFASELREREEHDRRRPPFTEPEDPSSPLLTGIVVAILIVVASLLIGRAFSHAVMGIPL